MATQKGLGKGLGALFGDNDQGKDQADRCGDSYNKSL